MRDRRNDVYGGLLSTAGHNTIIPNNTIAGYEQSADLAHRQRDDGCP